MDIKFENLAKIDLLIQMMEQLESKVSGAKRWLNITETAHYLGYSKEYIHKLKDSSFFLNKHYYKKSGKLLFDKDELDIWVTSSQTTMNPKEIAKEVLKDLI
ncbi:MAG: hypothetical protein U9R16_03220 [Campylobacterota bacterium]|nr:hypothetical protein [Campylobacterota bacterium]